MKEPFVNADSIVRKIWGKSDTVLLIFAGAAAEFALNKAVDWLYFTGRLPSDPIGRLFSTVSYSRAIVFSENDAALQTIDAMTQIHKVVEEKRGMQIPDWAYRDVLFMLIDYSIRSFELLERKLSDKEKEEVFDVFYRVGSRMKLRGLPDTLDTWEAMRAKQLRDNLIYSEYTQDLFHQYCKHLGLIRYKVLLRAQNLVIPDQVRKLLKSKKWRFNDLLFRLYQWARWLKVDWLVKKLLLPSQYQKKIKLLDQAAT